MTAPTFTGEVMLRCGACRLLKAETEFARHSDRITGSQHACKACAEQARRQDRARNPGKYRERERRRRTAGEQRADGGAGDARVCADIDVATQHRGDDGVIVTVIHDADIAAWASAPD